MKGLILALALTLGLPAAANVHPASAFVHQTLTRGQKILENKSDTVRLQQICALMNQRLGSGYISAVWLGNFANLDRDRRGIQRFTKMIPSIIVTKAVDAMGGNGGGELSGSFAVSPNASSRGNGYWQVGVTINTGGDSYSGNVIVWQNGNNYRMVDVEYMGFSAVNYLARDYQQFLTQEYNKDPNLSLPVTALVRSIESENGFVRCPGL